jgi:hypothetical protein
MGPRQSHEKEEVLVEEITDSPKSRREEEEVDVENVSTFVVGYK